MKKEKNKLDLANKILADINDELYLLKKRIQLKYTLTWAKARDYVNDSIKLLNGMHDNPALNFVDTKLTATDLYNVLEYLKKQKKRIKVNDIKLNYKKTELKDILKRLKMLGEIFDPYYTSKKEGIYVEVI